MEDNQLITRTYKSLGKRSVAIYKCAPKGYEFCKKILERYENMFTRSVRSPPPEDNLTKEHRYLAKIKPILIDDNLEVSERNCVTCKELGDI